MVGYDPDYSTSTTIHCAPYYGEMDRSNHVEMIIAIEEEKEAIRLGWNNPNKIGTPLKYYQTQQFNNKNNLRKHKFKPQLIEL